MSEKSASKAILTLLACYPSTKAEEQFVKMAILAVENFNDRTLAMLSDPKYGIMTTSKYLPSIAELVQWCKDFEYNSVPNKPKYVTFEEEKPVDEQSKNRIDDVLASLNFGRGIDKFQAYVKQMKPGDRMSVQDPKYIEFCKNFAPTAKPQKKPVVTKDEVDTIMSSFKEPLEATKKGEEMARFKNSLPYKDD